MISTTTSSISYTGNASTVTSYAIAFPLVSASHLVAIETDEDDVETTLDSGDFTFTPTTDLNGRITGGSVTTNPAIPATSTILFKRVTPRTQSLDFTPGGAFSAEALESALDKAIMINQELTRDLDAVDVGGAGDLLAANNLSDLDSASTARTNLGLGTAATAASGDFATAGALTTHAALTTGAHGMTAFGASLVDDADASAARTTLGLGTAATSATSAFEAAGGISTHAALTSSVHGISAFGATLVDDADAAAARTTLGLGTAATSATSAFEAAGGISTHAALTSSVHGISAFGATLIDDADASAARTTLGLAIGTNVQAYDADLAALAGLTSAADALPYFTGSGTASTTTLTSFARTLLDDADAATMRTTLGVTATDLASPGAIGGTTPGAGTFTVITSTANGAASTPPATLTGTIFTGGTSTTTKPAFLIEPTGTTSTSWSTAGTLFGGNAPSGFTGNLLDLKLNGGTSKLTVTSAGGIFTPNLSNTANQSSIAGWILESDGNGPKLRSDGAQATLSVSAGAFLYASGSGDVALQRNVSMPKTVTAAGTTGAQTINKVSGSVNFAAAATSLVVTNSLVTTSSIIMATVGTNDTTLKSVACVSASGSFTIYANAAATAETRVDFRITN